MKAEQCPFSGKHADAQLSLMHHAACTGCSEGRGNREAAPVVAEVKTMVAQERARSCARISFWKATCVLASLPATVSHLLMTMTHARPSAATSSASRKSCCVTVKRPASASAHSLASSTSATTSDRLRSSGNCPRTASVAQTSTATLTTQTPLHNLP